MALRQIPEYLTFDDVLMKPGASSVLPAEVSTATHITRDIELSIPIISAAMDTVTESKLAIAMAQAGGLGVIHKNLEPDVQAEHVRQVKRFESGMVINPITIRPDATLAEVMQLKERHRISGIPVVEENGKLAGIITNRDVRFATDMNTKVSELMTRNLITVKAGVDRLDAKRLLHKHRIEKLIVVNEDYECVGLITVNDMEKAADHPFAAKDEQERLACGGGDRHGRQGIPAGRNADRCRRRYHRGGYGAWPFHSCDQPGCPHQETFQQGADHRGQCGNGRGGEGADWGWR